MPVGKEIPGAELCGYVHLMGVRKLFV